MSWRYVFKKTVAGCSALQLEDEVVVAAVCVRIEMDDVATERKKAEVGSSNGGIRLWLVETRLAIE